MAAVTVPVMGAIPAVLVAKDKKRSIEVTLSRVPERQHPATHDRKDLEWTAASSISPS